MTVTLDAPAAPEVHGPIWKVGCDYCRDRRYLAGFSPAVAGDRAVREYGWRRVGRRLVCHRHPEVRSG